MRESIFDNALEWFLYFVVALFVFIIVAGIICGIREVTCERKEVKVLDVGGCNKYSCGVKYDDNTYGFENHPVVGQTLRVCK